MTITVYSKPDCQQCRATTRLLDTLGLPYVTVDLTTDPEAMALVTGWGFKAAPVVDANGERWGGFRDDLIRKIAQEAETRAAGEEVEAGTITDSDDDMNALCDARRGGKTVRVDLGDL